MSPSTTANDKSTGKAFWKELQRPWSRNAAKPLAPFGECSARQALAVLPRRGPAISGKRMIGSVLWIVADGLYVSRMAVLPHWRRCGIGSALLVACEDEARARGQRRLHLETRLVLAGNLRLFARFGYREFARLPPDGDPGKTLIKLEKRIE